MAPKAISAADLDNEGNIKVNLAHRFAKLKVVVNVTGATANPITALTIGGTQTTATFIPETDVLTLSGNVADIIPYRESTEASTSGPGYTTTYECILLPQQLAANTLKVTATAGEDTKSYTHAEALTLNSNYQYTLTLNMAYNGTMSPSGDVNVGTWGDEEEGGSGDLEEGAEISDNTYTVKTATGLLQWAQAAAQGQNPNLILTDDIDMTGKAWPAIGNYTGGTIDGGGHTISNLTLTGVVNIYIGLIAGDAESCAIKNLTLLDPHISMGDGYAFTGGFFVGGNVEYLTMENCHVIGGEISGRVSYPAGLGGRYARWNNYIACSVTSSNLSLIYSETYENTFTACYVIGGQLSVQEEYNDRTVNASYYQNGGSITAAADGSTVSSWSEAMTAMNQALSGTAYQWVENEGTDKDTRPLVISSQTTN